MALHVKEIRGDIPNSNDKASSMKRRMMSADQSSKLAKAYKP